MGVGGFSFDKLEMVFVRDRSRLRVARSLLKKDLSRGIYHE